MNKTSASPFCSDVLTDPRVTLREKIEEADKLVVRSPHLIKAVFQELAASSASDVFKRSSIDFFGDLCLPKVFDKLHISQQAADQITFAELMLLVRDTFRDGDQYDWHSALESTLEIADKLRFTQEENTAQRNRPGRNEDHATAFCLRQFLYSDPFIYIRQLLSHDDKLPVPYQNSLHLTYSVLYKSPRVFNGQDCVLSDVMMRCLGSVLQFCSGKVETLRTNNTAKNTDPLKIKVDHYVDRIADDLIVTPFALYAEARGESARSIRRTIEEMNKTASQTNEII